MYCTRLRSDEIEQMDSTLRAIPDFKIAAMQKSIECTWSKLFWSSIHGQLRDETSAQEVCRVPVHVVESKVPR